jgi:hypothetical protein
MQLHVIRSLVKGAVPISAITVLGIRTSDTRIVVHDSPCVFALTKWNTVRDYQPWIKGLSILCMSLPGAGLKGRYACATPASSV